MEQENVVKLLNKKKRGLLQKLFFSRLTIIVVLILLQIVLSLAIFLWFRQYLTHYELLRGVFTIAMVLYLFNSSMDSSSKLTWMMVIAVVPYIGAFFLWYSQTNIGHRTIHDRSAALIRRTKDTLPQDEQVLKDLEKDPYGTEDLHRYLNRSGCFPVYEYTPGFVHAKVAVSDGCRAVVGTINLDYRSLYHHFECAAYLYKVPCIPQIEQDFQETLAKCKKVTDESITYEKTFMKLKGFVMKLVAPLM